MLPTFLPQPLSCQKVSDAMKVYLVVNSPQYESSDIIAAYTDKIIAEEHVKRMKLQRQ